jgi:hypothetical protein
MEAQATGEKPVERACVRVRSAVVSRDRGCALPVQPCRATIRTHYSVRDAQRVAAPHSCQRRETADDHTRAVHRVAAAAGRTRAALGDFSPVGALISLSSLKP